MKRFLSILAVALTVLFAVFIVQNSGDVKLDFLFWSGWFPKALLMVFSAAVGFLIALSLFSGIRKQPADNKGAAQPEQKPQKETA